jgi:hypothetical protein
LLGEKRTPIAAATVDAAAKTASLSGSHAGVDADDADANTDSVKNVSNTTASVATGNWKPKEDAELTSALAKTKKKLRGKEYNTDWTAVAALGRTMAQCKNRWRNGLKPGTARATARATARKGYMDTSRRRSPTGSCTTGGR